jgi:hypothetical protein
LGVLGNRFASRYPTGQPIAQSAHGIKGENGAGGAMGKIGGLGAPGTIAAKLYRYTIFQI